MVKVRRERERENWGDWEGGRVGDDIGDKERELGDVFKKKKLFKGSCE